MSDTVDLGALARVLPPESDDGNREYKRLLVGVSDERFEELTTQLKWRCHEGDGEALYELGVSDDGEPVGLTESECAESLETLIRMAKGNRRHVLDGVRA